MRFILIILMVVISGCQNTKVEQPTEANNIEFELNQALDEYLAKVEQEKEEQYKSPKTIGGWREMVSHKSRSHYKVTPSMFGDKVSVEIILNDSGYINNIEVISSTGNAELNKVAVFALEKGQPYVISGLSEYDQKVAKHFVLTFAPE